MTAVDDIRGIFESYDPHNFEPSECLQRCIEYLDNSCAAGAECDPRDINSAMHASNVYGSTGNLFLHNDFPSAAEQLLTHAWNKFSVIQKGEKHRIYKAGI